MPRPGVGIRVEDRLNAAHFAESGWTVRASSAVPGQVDVGASGRNGAYPVAHGAIPVSATVVLDAPRATTGQCGRATFPGPPPAPSCRFNATGSTLTCR